MSQAKSYLVPEYYANFSCKCGECRTPCCRGFQIPISYLEYTRLIGMDCSPDLRRRLDCAFMMADSPTMERYALIKPNYVGECPLLREDGLCGIQKECGETVLPYVCRYYPRGPHIAKVSECACSNSCEAVVELLYRQTEPLRFTSMELSFDHETPAPLLRRPLEDQYIFIRNQCMKILQDRSLPLTLRIVLLGESLLAVERGETPPESVTLPEADLPLAIPAFRSLFQLFSDSSYAKRTFIDPAVLQIGEDPTRYRAAKSKLLALAPDWYRFAEQLLVNHAFFERFPFSDLRESMEDEYISFSAAYAAFTYAAAGYIAGQDAPALSDLFDVCAGAFRLIGHTGFDNNAAQLIRAQGIGNHRLLATLIASI